jgi:CBS-domain-containing membrane protein
MEVTGIVSTILAKKDPTVWSIAPNAMVIEAIQLMSEKNVGALPVVENANLLGVISERDYTRKVILKGILQGNSCARYHDRAAHNRQPGRQRYRVHADNDRKARAPSSGSRRNQTGRDPIDRRLDKLDHFGTESGY